MTTPTPDQEPTTAAPAAAETPPPRVKVTPPRFRRQSPSAPLSSPDEPTDAGADAGDAFPGASELPPESEPTRTGASRTSSRADRAAARKLVAALFGGATELAHEFLVHDEYSKATELLVADDEDVDAVSEPGGDLLARRMGDGPVNKDVADGVALAIALVGYLLKQGRKLRRARQLRRGGAAINGLQPDLPAEHPDREDVYPDGEP